MKNAPENSFMWENARCFLNSDLIRQVNRLAGSRHLDHEERGELLRLSSALAALPELNDQWSCDIEIDFSWEDLNWVGKLEMDGGKFSLFSTMHEIKIGKPEAHAKWQHTALKLINEKDLSFNLTHDPSHLWLWIRCFRRFVDRFLCWGDKNSQGIMKFNSLFVNFTLNTPNTEVDEEPS